MSYAQEGDEEVGLTYFGERYLIARIGRWASPDPLQIHAAGGGEVGNSYHYVSGNILASRDAVGLDGTDLLSEQNRAPLGAFAWTDSGASWLAATGRTQVERLANAIRNGPGAASDTTRSVDAALDSTGKGGDRRSGLNVGGWTKGGIVDGNTGFRRELRDPWSSSSNQVGHFLTAVNHAMHGLQGGVLAMPSARGATDAALRADVGHEILGDPAVYAHPSTVTGWEAQFNAATDGDVRIMRAAIDLAKSSSRASGVVDVAGVMSVLAPIVQDHAIPRTGNPGDDADNARRGNSQQDLLLTTMGWAFGELVQDGAFASKEGAAQWLERNLGQPPAAAPTGQRVRDSGGSSPPSGGGSE